MGAALLQSMLVFVAGTILPTAPMADQSSGFPDGHELPTFVVERVELPWGMSGEAQERIAGSRAGTRLE
jgi:hypothetical protein